MNSSKRASADPAIAGSSSRDPQLPGVSETSVGLLGHAPEATAVAWTDVVAESREYLPGRRRARDVADSAISQLSKPYNADIACELTLAALVLIIESHRSEAKVNRKMLNDLTSFARSVASLRDARSSG